MIAGLDEAGRGCWAGPVVAAAVILPRHIKIPGLTDSKKLTQKRREELYLIILRKCSVGVGIATHQEVDHFGLIKATERAFRRALNKLTQTPTQLQIDGRDRFQFKIPSISIIKGDAKVRAISAASIIAKVTRDRIMDRWSEIDSHYGFKAHKGYGTQKHRRFLSEFGVSNIHRRTYRPIQAILKVQ